MAASRFGLIAAGITFAVAATAQQAGGEGINAGVAPAAAPTTAASAPAAGAVDVAKARESFNNWSCGACHQLSDAGASGPVGPALDGNTGLTHDLIVDRITNGAGPMPAFGGQMTPEEIEMVTAYIMQVKK